MHKQKKLEPPQQCLKKYNPPPNAIPIIYVY